MEGYPMSPADRSTAYFIWPAKMPLFQDHFAPQRLAQRQKAALQSLGTKALNHDRSRKK
jgi:hypothetical protein